MVLSVSELYVAVIPSHLAVPLTSITDQLARGRDRDHISPVHMAPAKPLDRGDGTTSGPCNVDIAFHIWVP